MVGRLTGILLALAACRGAAPVTELRSCKTADFCTEYSGAWDDEVGLHELCAAEHGTFAPGGCPPAPDAKGVCTEDGSKHIYFASYFHSIDELAKLCAQFNGTFVRGKAPAPPLSLQH